MSREFLTYDIPKETQLELYIENNLNVRFNNILNKWVPFQRTDSSLKMDELDEIFKNYDIESWVIESYAPYEIEMLLFETYGELKCPCISEITSYSMSDFLI